MERLSERLSTNNFKGPGFDRIRLIAATTVVFHHCSTYLTDDIANDALFKASGGLVNFGHLAVYIFFVTSGILVTPGLLRSRDVTTFAAHRFVRIMPALFVVVVATAFLVGPVLTTLSPKEYFESTLTYRYLNNIIFRAVSFLPGVQSPEGIPIIVNGSLWTIYYEVLSYAALAGMFLIGALHDRKRCVTIFVAVYMLNLLFWFTDGIGGNVPDRVVTFVDLFVYFLAGASFFVISDKIPYDFRILLMSLAVLISSIYIGYGFFFMQISVTYIIVYIGYSKWLGKTSLKSDYSYGVYLSHAVALTALLIAFPSVTSFFVATPIVLGLAFTFSLLSWRFVEEPCLRRKKLVSESAHRWMTSLRRRRRARRPALEQPTVGLVAARPTQQAMRKH